MSSLFGEVWFWSLLAFLIGALLTWVLLVRPLQQRSNQQEQQLREQARGAGPFALAAPAPPVEPVYRQPDSAEWPADPSPESEPLTPASRTQWLEQDSLPQRPVREVDDFDEFQYDDDYAEPGGYYDREPAAYDDGEPGGYDDSELAAYDDRELDYEPERPEDAGLESAPTEVQPPVPAPQPAVDEEPGGVFEPAQPASAEVADRLGGDDEDGFDALDAPSGATRRVPVKDQGWPDSPTQIQPRASEPEPVADDEPEVFTRRVPRRSASTPTPIPPHLVQPPAQPAAAPAVPVSADVTQQPAAAKAPVEAEPSFFEEEQPTTAIGTDGQLPDIEPEFDPETGLPKRTRGASTHVRGGFEPPRPIQPSVRPIARRSPQAEPAAGGSLFEPTATEAISAPGRAPVAEQREVPLGPFGPGSAMPLPGGGRPGPEFTVKG
ncbi:MAG: hypothetical protein ACRDQF_22085, partial [Thermocrispum sp.]